MWIQSIITGIISGVLSGFIVSKYFEIKANIANNNRICLRIGSLYYEVYKMLNNEILDDDVLLEVLDRIDYEIQGLHQIKYRSTLRELTKKAIIKNFVIRHGIKVGDYDGLKDKIILKDIMYLSSELPMEVYKRDWGFKKDMKDQEREMKKEERRKKH